MRLGAEIAPGRLDRGRVLAPRVVHAVPVEQVELGALLVVHDHVDRDRRPVRPAEIRRVRAVPHEVPRRARTGRRQRHGATLPQTYEHARDMTFAVSSARLVEVSDLVKRYPRSPVNAVDGVSFAVQPGETFGLLGPNGAGKTTTIGVLTTRVRPTSGSARIGGVDVVRNPVEARRQLAVVPQRNNLDRSLSVRDNLIFHAAYHGVPPRVREARGDELLAQVGLLDRARAKADFFSGCLPTMMTIVGSLTNASG